MKRQKIGQFLFWLGVVLSVLWVALTVIQGPTQRVHTAEQLRGTVHEVNGFLFILRISAGGGMAIALVGVLLSTSKKGSYIWLSGFLLAFINFGLYWQPSQHIPALFGAGGTIMLLSYLGILWVWSRGYTAYQGAARTGRLIQLIGITVLMTAGQLLCMFFGNPHVLALADLPIPSGELINMTLSLGMLLLFVGHYVANKGSGSPEVRQES